MHCSRSFSFSHAIAALGEERAKIVRLTDLTSQLISSTEASKLSGMTTGFIRRLLRRGDLDGIKIGRNWLTTREAIDQYLKKERRPGPKPQAKNPLRRNRLV